MLFDNGVKTQLVPTLAIYGQVCRMPRAVVVLCGKRKSGKDHVAANLVDM